ncbi:MAG: Mini-ribonuclease 3 [Breznakia sp.]
MQYEVLNGTTLAYMGDAVYALQIREHLIQQGYQKPKILQERSVLYVSAKAQAKSLKFLMDNHFLTETEIGIVKRGRNAKTQSVAKNTDVITYRNATGFEALWGYLYFGKKAERLEKLCRLVVGEIEK